MQLKRTIAALAGGVGLWAALVGAASAQPAATPVVQTASGPIRGVEAPDGRAVFRAIPFAQPPVGPLRWRAPQPVTPWREVREAVRPAPACLQNFVGWNRSYSDWSSEDCLYLDIATPSSALPAKVGPVWRQGSAPAKTSLNFSRFMRTGKSSGLDASARLPVMVWIHGGANLAGGMADTVTSSLVRRGIVLVAIQYRLGALGFLSLPSLTAEQGGASGNYGLMDQIAALTWVKANIARFGGDPDNITIFGESAGAQDVGLLSLAPSTQGLFAREIQESGTAGFGLPPRSLKENEALGEQFAGLAGAPEGEGGLAALRAAPPERILAADAALQKGPMQDFVWLHAVTDGRVFTQTPAEILASGRPLRPLLIGSNAREIDFLRRPDVAKAAERFWDAGGLEASKPDRVEPDARFGDALLQAAGDAMFRCPAEFTARAFAQARTPAWLYLFDIPNHAPVSHATELPFVFDDLPAGPAGVTLQAYWANFARTGDPNGPGLPQWPRFGSKRAYVDFEPEGPAAGRDLRGATCERLGRP